MFVVFAHQKDVYAEVVDGDQVYRVLQNALNGLQSSFFRWPLGLWGRDQVNTVLYLESRFYAVNG